MTQAPILPRHKDEAKIVWTHPGNLDDYANRFAQTLANLEAARADLAEASAAILDALPWTGPGKCISAMQHDRLAAIATPYRASDPVAEALKAADAIDTLVELLAPVLTHSQGMAAGEREARFRGAMAALIEGDRDYWAKWTKARKATFTTPSPCPSCAAKDEAMAAFKADVSEAASTLIKRTEKSCTSLWQGVTREALSRFIIPPADPVADWLQECTDGRVSSHTITMLNSFRRWYDERAPVAGGAK